MTISELYNYLKANLSSLYSDGAERLAFVRRLFAHISGLGYQDTVMNPGREVAVSQDYLDGILARVADSEPLEYIFNSAQFLDLELVTNSSVLIPRPETEELAIMIGKELSASPRPLRLLDIGTGSGCLPVYLQHTHPENHFYACDISQRAIDTARENAARYGCQIDFMLCDILDFEHCPSITSQSYDIIVSNPPYVLDSERELMCSNVLDHEPHNALFVPDADPLLFYRRICEFAARYLDRGGRLFFEINERFGKETAALMESCGFQNVEIIRDLFMKDRFVSGSSASI